MSRSLTFVYLDGREIRGATPREVLEALRNGESASPLDLGRFLDSSTPAPPSPSRSRSTSALGASLDVRCRAAVTSLIQHGWLRIKEDRGAWPRPRGSASMAERKASTAAS